MKRSAWPTDEQIETTSAILKQTGDKSRATLEWRFDPQMFGAPDLDVVHPSVQGVQREGKDRLENPIE